MNRDKTKVETESRKRQMGGMGRKQGVKLGLRLWLASGVIFHIGNRKGVGKYDFRINPPTENRWGWYGVRSQEKEGMEKRGEDDGNKMGNRKCRHQERLMSNTN
ncbi:hypothetical protein AMECASPLE_032832 [Ameca splendens]|uniref:Uncharacterized protein n=1 Tax=Ameca splendens TaxID=208324 RepID=A0ABV0XVJ2_9TELE